MDGELLELCAKVADAVGDALRDFDAWGQRGNRPGQYAADLVADAAALDVLSGSGVGVLSEESGARDLDAPFVAVVDPLDGSTNASRGVPWYATSVCVVDELGPRAAVVANQVSGVRYSAVRGKGAFKSAAGEGAGDTPIVPSSVARLGDAIVGLSGYPEAKLGWSQYRALGAAALDMCLVAEGVLDAYAVVGRSRLGSWDYLGGLLVCSEAGAAVAEATGRGLVILDHNARRAPVAAATPELLDELRSAMLEASSGG